MKRVRRSLLVAAILAVGMLAVYVTAKAEAPPKPKPDGPICIPGRPCSK